MIATADARRIAQARLKIVQMKKVFTIILLLISILFASPLTAQWTVKTRRIAEGSDDGHITLSVDLPVVVGEKNPVARKAINRALGVASDIDRLRKETLRAIRNHNEVLKRRAKSKEVDEFEEDFADERTTEYEVGINDGKLLSICLKGYWHGGGGAVGNPYWVGCTFDAESGKRLQLQDLLIGEWEPFLRHLFKEYLQPRSDDLFPEWESKLQKTEFGFYLEQKDMLIFFPKYSLGPGAMDVISIEIPYVRLKRLIAPNSPLSHLLK